MKFLIETGNEWHSTSWQKCQAKDAKTNKPLFQNKQTIVSQEWLENTKHATVVKTVYELPEGTEILLEYQSFLGSEKKILRLDASQEVQEEEIGTSNLRSYTMKGRYTIIRDLMKEKEESLKASQEQGF